jgi:hypothetical protein
MLIKLWENMWILNLSKGLWISVHKLAINSTGLSTEEYVYGWKVKLLIHSLTGPTITTT